MGNSYVWALVISQLMENLGFMPCKYEVGIWMMVDVDTIQIEYGESKSKLQGSMAIGDK